MKQFKLVQFLFLILLSGIGNMAFAQEKEIVKILNRELKKEVKNQIKSSNFNGDTIRIIEEFSITKDKKLTFTIKKTSPNFTGYQIIKQEVPLNKILKIAKDLQIILETERNAVSETFITFNEEKKEEKLQGSMFFVYLTIEKRNEHLGDELQKAFEKAGYKVTKEYWYD
ncbi:hypothetical protein SAMN05443633_11375 [Chryseobacterium arachidis]|uniref:Intein N-terminal splicing region n=1 Tax=Chryseobacterium arachidis TaxID=1416778 RepID=A0A1M5IUP4_9FLAO|nr:hypothetical protein [Chryseobacterium arachidis]SHG32037.1 hypothetical protein SAMN05443633_11375 [Chryseobacterium arachidis]